jgi:hypothetical protein
MSVHGPFKHWSFLRSGYRTAHMCALHGTPSVSVNDNGFASLAAVAWTAAAASRLISVSPLGRVSLWTIFRLFVEKCGGQADYRRVAAGTYYSPLSSRRCHGILGWMSIYYRRT